MNMILGIRPALTALDVLPHQLLAISLGQCVMQCYSSEPENPTSVWQMHIFQHAEGLGRAAERPMAGTERVVSLLGRAWNEHEMLQRAGLPNATLLVPSRSDPSLVSGAVMEQQPYTTESQQAATPWLSQELLKANIGS